jgi:hypothetical protein
MGLLSSAFFLLVGEGDRIPWLVVVLSLIYVAFLMRRDSLIKRLPRSKDAAFREAAFAFGFTSLVMFALANFGTPEDLYAPLRVALTMGLSWGVVGYRLSRGYPQRPVLLVLTLLAVAVPVTCLWMLASKFLGG